MPEKVSLKVLQKNKIKSRQFLINCPKELLQRFKKILEGQIKEKEWRIGNSRREDSEG